MPDDDKLHRRQFFRRGLSELLKPLANSLEPLARTLNEFDRATGGQQKAPQPAQLPAATPKNVPLKLWLRPPGALRETQFKAQCQRCGDCVRVCPAEAIKLVDGQGDGVPFIDADSAACVVCDGLQCMSACPTGAIVETPLAQIKMGTAVWHAQHCTRNTRHDECQACVDICPLGTAAIDTAGDEIAVKPLGCIGCGLCQLHCPTSPKSITIIPIAARQV